MKTTILKFIEARNTTENETPVTDKEIISTLNYIKDTNKEQITKNLAKNYIEHIEAFGL